MRTFSFSRSGQVAVALLSLAVWGCAGGNSAKLPELHPVSGTVKLDGKPLAGATVSFMPKGQAQGLVSFAVTDADGKYVAEYPGAGETKGIPVGDYKVLISKLVTPSGGPIPEGKTAADVEAKDIIPARYKRLDDLVNTVSISSGGKQGVDFELMSK